MQINLQQEYNKLLASVWPLTRLETYSLRLPDPDKCSKLDVEFTSLNEAAREELAFGN